MQRVLIPVDIEHRESWREPIAAARRLLTSEVELHALYVLPAFETALVGSFFPDRFEEQALSKAGARLAALTSEEDTAPLPKPHLHVLHGPVYREVLRAAGTLSIDLIIVQAHRRGAEDYLLGSNAARIARHAKQSVLVLRPDP